MSGVVAQAVSHVVRRSVERMPTTTHGISVGLGGEGSLYLSTFTAIALGAILIVTVFIIGSVDYTVGSVMGTLAMIESPSTTTILESAPPAYTDEPDAPLEQKKKIDIEDVEIVVINHKPITASVVGTIKHLHSVGGFFGRWRGAFQSIIYHMLVNVAGHAFGGLFNIVFGHHLAQCFGYTVSIVALCRLRMLWTHAMIAAPTNTRWYKRFVERKQCKALLLPSLIFALSQQAVLLLPLLAFAVTQTLLSVSISAFDQQNSVDFEKWYVIGTIVLSLTVVPVTALMVALFFYLPAVTTLTRIEACLLPEDQETIVPFDRQAIMGDIDLTQRCSSMKLFSAARKSFTNSARLRLVKLYFKLSAFQFAVLLVAVHATGAIVYFFHKDQLVSLYNGPVW